MLMRLLTNSKHIVRILVCTVVLSTLASCGFALRKSTPLPFALQDIEVSSLESVSELRNITAKYFAQKSIQFAHQSALGKSRLVTVQDDYKSMPRAFLILAPEKIERRLLSAFSTGQVAEYELNFTVRYSLRLPDVPAQNYTLYLTREYQDDPKQVLAKSRELNLILNELRKEAAATIWQRLPLHYNALKNLNRPTN